MEHFAANRQRGKLKTEVGGQLFANFLKNQVHVIRATGPNYSDKRGWSWFRPDQKEQNSEIKRLFRKGFHFVGDWHTHPELEPQPSILDLKSMEECFNKSKHQLTAFIMVIVGQADFPKGLWVSLHKGDEYDSLGLASKQTKATLELPERKHGQVLPDV